jgi:hypothetical protein
MLSRKNKTEPEKLVAVHVEGMLAEAKVSSLFMLIYFY